MSNLDDQSNKQIAQQFLLPERQAKVNLLLKAMEQSELEEHSGHSPVYCICRSSVCDRFMIACDCCEEWYHGDCVGVTQVDALRINKYFCDDCRDRKPFLEIKYNKKRAVESWSSQPTCESDVMQRVVTKEYRSKLREQAGHIKSKKSSRRCGECTACHIKQDCGRCDFCKDMRKFCGPNKIRQKCRLRQCKNFGISMNKFGRFTVGLQDPEEDPDGHIAHPYSECDSDADVSVAGGPTHLLDRKERKQPCTDLLLKSKERKVKINERNQQSSKIKQKSSSSLRRQHQENEHVTVPGRETARQCYGPGCVRLARPHSKYCSDDCGMILAKRRIYEILPSQIQRWQSSPCVGEESNKRTLERLRHRQTGARQRIDRLDRKHRELDTLLERARQIPVDHDFDGGEGDDEAELSIFCVTCGQEINQRGAIKHMEKCFAKFESQTSFGSIYKTRIEGNSMFCDYYNPQQKTYCKRLKVLCPEHTKEGKVGMDDICGCPLRENVFEEKAELCRISKRKCSKHFCWEKLRRAQIDLERLRQWMKLDELFEQERNVRQAMSNRMGVLGLMLHQTIDHDPLTPMTALKS